MIDTNDYQHIRDLHDQIEALGWDVSDEYAAYTAKAFAWKSFPSASPRSTAPLRYITNDYVADLEINNQWERSWEQLLADVRAWEDSPDHETTRVYRVGPNALPCHTQVACFP